MGKVVPIASEIKAKILDEVRNNGMTVSETATQYGVNPRTIYGWLKQDVVGSDRNLILELNKLKRENEQLYKLLGRATAEMQKSKS